MPLSKKLYSKANEKQHVFTLSVLNLIAYVRQKLAIFKSIPLSFRYFQRVHANQFAAALSYSTLLSAIPIALLLFYISMQTDAFASIFLQAREQLLLQLLPTSREQANLYLLQSAQSIESFSYLSIVVIILSAVWLSLSAERTINYLWQVKVPRKLSLRIPAHIVLWLLTPLLIILSISVSTWLTSLPYFKGIAQQAFTLPHLLPWAISSLALFLLYFFVPNTKVKYSTAATSALSAALLFEVSKWGFTIYITEFAMYEKIYGALATLPVFMLWVFVSWSVILWGVSLSIVLQKQGH